MVIKIKRRTSLTIGTGIVVIIVIFYFAMHFLNLPINIIAGGNIHSIDYPPIESQTVFRQQDEIISERFQRPSKQAALLNKYSFNDFEKQDAKAPLITKTFESSEDVILAYYGILEDASNMLGYSGGCGTIGSSKLPYPYAYELYTKESQSKMDLDQFIRSFEGIGYTTLLKIYPAYIPPQTPHTIQYYMVEIEVITGKQNSEERRKYNQQISYFAYYYGIITVERTPKDGYKIKQIDYLPEEFLCAPLHGWFYDADAVIEIVYKQNLKIIDTIGKTEQNDGLIHIYASGNNQQYRFDFVRLTNGHDILLHENTLENGQWKESNLLTDKWENFKFSILNSDLLSKN